MIHAANPSQICNILKKKKLHNCRQGPAQLTCRTLDEDEGTKEVRLERWTSLSALKRCLQAQFSVLWLNPGKPETFPPDILEALEQHSIDWNLLSREAELTLKDRLRQQMLQDKLQPLREDEDESAGTSTNKTAEPCLASPGLIEEVAQFLRLRVESYLKDRGTVAKKRREF